MMMTPAAAALHIAMQLLTRPPYTAAQLAYIQRLLQDALLRLLQLLYLALLGVGFLRSVTPSTRDNFDSTCTQAIAATARQGQP
jgi:hypothetical protein